MPKESIREKREREKRDRIQRFKEQEKERPQLTSLEIEKNDLREPHELNRRKSSMNARAAKIKSTLFIADKVVMTSYDDNNFLNTTIEKEIEGTTVKDIYEPGSFDINKVSHKIDVRRGRQTASVDNPSFNNNPGEDQIHAKSKLEQQFFGKTFNDNIHIQIIYNILDVEKILAEYLNIIVFALNNVTGANDSSDFVGNLYSKSSYDAFKGNKKNRKKFNYFLEEYINNDRLKYYASAFFIPNNKNQLHNKENNASIPRDPQQIYAILTFISQWRQFLFHPESKENMYDPESWMTDKQKKIVNEVYTQNINNFNGEFYDINKKTINMLLQACNISEKDYNEFAKRFYDFAAKKRHKRFGISIDKLFENITQLSNKEMSQLPKERSNSSCVKFIIYNYYLDNLQERVRLINLLRTNSRNNVAKDILYQQEAKRLYNKIGKTVSLLTSSKNLENEIDQQKLKSVFKKYYLPADNLMFCKCIYFLTLFLNSKEKNELIASLNYKFESIAGFIKVLQSQGEMTSFSEKYAMFNDSKNIAYHFQDLFGLSRMSVKDKLFYKNMFNDLCKTFGEKSEPEVFLNNRPLFNFAQKHIVNSWQFSYLMHYATPEMVYNINHTPKLIKFVLEGMPEDKIDEYFEVFFDDKRPFRGKKIELLTDKIIHTSFVKDIVPCFLKSPNEDKPYRAFFDKKQEHMNNRKTLNKQVSLYFTIPYLLIKNLLSVNSRYFIAFYSLERDHRLFYGEEAKNEYCRIADNFEKDRHNKSALISSKCMRDTRAIRVFRNKVAHINVLLTLNNDYISFLRFGKFEKYFELYHYLMQLQMSKEYASKEKTVNEECIATKYVLDDVKNKYHTYNREFVKMICYPFSYNIPRYRNLTENILFDPRKYNKNSYLKHKKALDEIAKRGV